MPEPQPAFVPAMPVYGGGVFVRSLEIRTPSPGRVSLAMEDVVHAFQIDFTHEHDRVTSVHTVWNRRPMSSCGGATRALEAMVGCRLGDTLFSIARHTDARQQCTHLYDMFCLAATHAHEIRPDVRYDLFVPDSLAGPLVATLNRNGETVLTLKLERDLTIVWPEPLRGVSVLKGFLSWVRANVPAERHAHYFIMQKALFVSQIQTIDVESLLGASARLSGPPDASCYASQPERYESAVRVGVLRRFTPETANDVLTFFKPR